MRPPERRSENLLRALRSTVKEAVWLLTNHEPGSRPDVALFATRRGGSTWMMEVINAAPGFRSLDQPFSVMTANLTPGHYRRMPKYPSGEIVCPAPEQFDELRAHVEDLLAGSLPVNAPFRPWADDFRWRTSRQVLKIVGAKSLIVWLDDEFDLDIVYLTRHPITQALSCIRNGWSLTVRAYLDNPRFVDEHLDSRTESLAHDILASGTDLDRFVLNWGLENLIPLRAAPDRPDWTVLSYEDCVLRPDDVARELASAVDLGDPEELLAAINRPSRSSRLSTSSRRTAIELGDATLLLRRPLERVPLEDRRQAMTVLGELGIDLYQPGESGPRHGG